LVKTSGNRETNRARYNNSEIRRKRAQDSAATAKNKSRTAGTQDRTKEGVGRRLGAAEKGRMTRKRKGVSPNPRKKRRSNVR